MFKDNNDPVLFNSPALETANMTVLHCREVLEKTGMTQEAQQLHGISVTDPLMAQVALDVLQKMRVNAEALYAKKIAIENLEAVLAT